MQSKIETRPNDANKYTHQFLFIYKNDALTWQQTFLLGAYKRKWASTQDDPTYSRLHVISFDGSEKLNDEKFSCLKLADDHSRITLVAHHKLSTDYFYSDNKIKLDYKKFVDILRENVTEKSVLITPQIAIQTDRRALRLTFYACNVGVRIKGTSLAEKIFDYACNHKTKPLRIEMTAPLMFCGPVVCNKDKNIKAFKTYIAKDDSDVLHKRYATFPYYHGKFFLFGAGLFSFLHPKYRPDNCKRILKIDYSVSLFGKVKPKIMSPEEEKKDYKCGSRYHQYN